MHRTRVNTRCLALCFFLVLGMSALSVQLVRIQIVERHKYAQSADNSYKREFSVAHTRGMILDRNDEVIARDILLKSVKIDKYQFLSVDVASRSLAGKYLREVVGKKDVKIKEPCLQPLVNKTLKESPTWEAIPESKRKSLVMQAARKLQENLDVETIKKRNVDFVVEDYHRPLGVTKEKLKELLDLKSSQKHVLVVKGIDAKAARMLEKLLDLHDVKGFDFEHHVIREYKDPDIATHLTGVANHERKGVSGVEGQLETYLSGRDGVETRYIDVRGYVIPGDQEILPPKHGRDVRLTIDMQVQAIVEEELDKGMEEFGCKKGSIVVVDPHTGQVLAMASRPHFNLNNREEMNKNGFNYAIQAANETGSTVKIIAGAAALDQGLTAYDTVFDTGWGPIKEKGFEVKDDHNYGDMPFWKIYQKSNNKGTWMLATLGGIQAGMKRFYDYADRFGYGKRTGIRLIGESKGGLGKTGKPIDFSRCAYGYVLTASPLQIAGAYSVLANGGYYIPPHIVMDVHAKNGTVIEYSSREKQELKQRVIKKRTSQLMLNALATVLEDAGTAKLARSEGYISGGKTGTNHKVVNGKYDGSKVITSFAGICPINKPDFVCVVVMDEPKERMVWNEKENKMVKFKRYGGTVAAPIFSRVVKRVAPLRGIEPIYSE